MGEKLSTLKGKMVKVIVTASNGKTKLYKTKGNFDVPFNALAPSIKDSTYFFRKKDLEFIENTLVPKGCTAYDAKQFVIGGKNSSVYSVPMDGRTKLAKTLPYLQWDDVYQFMMDNATPTDVNEWLKRA